MNTILIVLIVVVIYLIHISSPKKEDFLSGLFNNIDCSTVKTDTCRYPWIKQKCKNECAKIAQCKEWAFGPSNKCATEPGYMVENCREACEEKTAENILRFR